MTTFSQLVDEMVKETRRPDMIAEIARYCNQTVRELHFDSQANAVLLFADNFREARLVASTEDGFGWDIPNPQRWQKMLAVRYDGVCDSNGSVYARPTTPGRHLRGQTRYFYQMGQQFVFSGYGGINAPISIGYYEYPSSLVFKKPADRLVKWNMESEEFEYDVSLTTPEAQAAALSRETNWVLTRWSDVVAEGVRAKVYKSRSDTERARTSYSLYMSLRQGMWTSEISPVQEVT